MRAAPVGLTFAPEAEPSLDRLRVLLLQIRGQRGAELHEQKVFREVSGVAAERWRFHNLVERPEVPAAEVAAADAVVIGGAGAHSVTERHEFTEPLAELVRDRVRAGRPLFGSCYGHQFIAWALGGTVETDLSRKELGTHDVELTAAGEGDPVFAGLPRRFPVQLGHNDHVTRLPPDAVELARSARSANQAFRIGELPVYGTQFHPELDERTMVERVRAYASGYLTEDDAMTKLLAELRPSPEASSLLRRFLAIAAT